MEKESTVSNTLEKGTTGTIKNTAGQKLHGRVTEVHNYSFHFRIDGIAGCNSFFTNDWTFTEDTPTVQQQFDAFPIGTKFNTFARRPDDYFLKVGRDQVVLVGDDGKARKVESLRESGVLNSGKLYERKDS